MKIVYRPEIDGLRAISIALVVIYHSKIYVGDFILLSGGYLGVDIFFVISGFLISSILIKEYQATNSINLKNFFERRFRRILPLLVSVLCISSLVSYFILLPLDLKEFNFSLISSLFFNSNHFFYFNDLEYGTKEGLYKPLLHTWSLAVEEQFYIFFPLFLILICKFFNKNKISIFVLFTVISFIFANLLTLINSKLSFYVLPSRIWELLIGTLIVFSISKVNQKKKLLFYSLPKIGIILIFFSSVFFDDETFHPSLKTIMPILGAVFIILFSNPNELVTKFLSTKLMIFIGKISFSIYLWHFPIFAFARYTDFMSGNNFSNFVIGITVIFLSVVSYYLIEQPFRRKKIELKKIFLIIGIFSAILITTNVLSIYTKGFSNRLPPSFLESFNISEKPWNKLKDGNGNICHNKEEGCQFFYSNSKKIYLIGDSHLGAINFELVKKLVNDGYDVQSNTYGGCGLFFDFYNVYKFKNEKKDCRNSEIGKIEKNIKNSIVVVLFNYSSYFENSSFDINSKNHEKKNRLTELVQKNEKKISLSLSFKNTLDTFLKNNNKIILVYPIPEIGQNVPRKIKNYISKEFLLINKNKDIPKQYLSIPYDIFLNRNKKVLELFNRIESKNIKKVYPSDIFCNEDLNLCFSHNKNEFFYADEDHLSIKGAEKLNKMILEKIYSFK
jgi:peptidoglycan/LPS O-acetylase OafA/YrhL